MTAHNFNVNAGPLPHRDTVRAVDDQMTLQGATSADDKLIRNETFKVMDALVDDSLQDHTTTVSINSNPPSLSISVSVS